MYKLFRTPKRKPVSKAYADIRTPEPRISSFVVFLLKMLARLYLFLFLGVAKAVLQGEDHVFKAFERALSKKSRCIIAFRHPNGGEPQLLSWFFLLKLKGLALKKGIRFARPPHAVFVYGYEVVRWGGWVAKFVMPNVGAMPVYHAKIDRKGMTRINDAIAEGPYPVALAPEGHVSYTTDSVLRLEPGLFHLGFHAAHRLSRKGSDCSVEVLPLSVHFSFGSWGVLTLELLLRKIERVCGFSGWGRRKLPFTERTRQCRDHILEANEKRYQIKSDTSLSFADRLNRVIASALETSERMMGLKSEGEYFNRFYMVRQLCWDQIFLPGIYNLNDKTQVERSILDLKAGEAWYISRHVELIDFCWYFRVPIPEDDAALHKKIEYSQNLWDFASRTIGGEIKNRVSVFPRKVIIRAAPVINLSERLPAYQRDRKEAITQAVSDLEKEYLNCISNWRSG